MAAAEQPQGPVGQAPHTAPEKPRAPLASGDQHPGEALRGEEGAQGSRHIEGRSASPPEHPHGIWDKSAYFWHTPNRVLDQNTNRILIHPALLLKPPSRVRDIKVEGWASPADQGEKLVARAGRPLYLPAHAFLA